MVPKEQYLMFNGLHKYVHVIPHPPPTHRCTHKKDHLALVSEIFPRNDGWLVTGLTNGPRAEFLDTSNDECVNQSLGVLRGTDFLHTHTHMSTHAPHAHTQADTARNPEGLVSCSKQHPGPMIDASESLTTSVFHSPSVSTWQSIQTVSRHVTRSVALMGSHIKMNAISV